MGVELFADRARETWSISRWRGTTERLSARADPTGVISALVDLPRASGVDVVSSCRRFTKP